ncbi:MAG TPA: hypothetical protein V6D15_20035 [Oculatellaceae cyanobacterium]|jgi:Gpi18-like mannosyltransferase
MEIISKSTSLKFLRKQINKLSTYLYHPVPKIFFYSIIFAIIIRLICVPNKSSDFKSFLEPWYNFIVEHGGFSALKYGFADYTPPYLYWLIIASSHLSWLPKIFAIKLFAMSFDFICAFFTYKLVSLKYPSGQKPTIAFLAVVLTPTVIYNSALWGQCDSIYTTGLIACVYFLCIQQVFIGFLCFSLAVSFKLQAMFLLPFLLAVSVKKINYLKYFLLIPFVYLAAIIPALFAGRPMIDLLLIYFNQSTKYKELAKRIPNLYQWISNEFYNIVVPLGLIFTVSIIVLFIRTVYTNKVNMNHEYMIQLAFASVLFMPYLLPKMHQRYFFPADILSIVFGFYFPKYYYIPIILQIASLFSYLGTPILIKLVSIPLGIILWIVLKEIGFIGGNRNYEYLKY